MVQINYISTLEKKTKTKKHQLPALFVFSIIIILIYSFILCLLNAHFSLLERKNNTKHKHRNTSKTEVHKYKKNVLDDADAAIWTINWPRRPTLSDLRRL